MRPTKIGILTFHFSDNFGAVLQAYGLKAWLVRQGCDVEFINYHPTHIEDGGEFRNLFDLRATAKIAYLKLSNLKRKLFGDRKQADGFEEFRRCDLGLSGPSLRTLTELEAHLAESQEAYDIIVLGSDQIWAASQQAGLDPVYFGAFKAPPRTRRISYAPSFGRATIDKAHRNELARMIGMLDAISCREHSGVSIVRELIGKNVPCVPDPTLLHGDFKVLTANGNGPEGHVFCYALRSAKGIREVATWVGDKLGVEVLSPYNVHRRWREIGKTFHPTPSEWVTGIDRASFVVTNSFHGTVFSILLRTPFLVVGLPGERASLNERSLNLLRELELLDRFVENGDLAGAKRKFSEPIDWETVHARLRLLQTSGRAYLQAELLKVMPK